MFARPIIDSARFLKMPVSSQALYFHLGLRADDDGVVEAWSVLQTTGTSEDDLRVLVSKGFVVVLNEDLVSYITDWSTHNSIRPDRKIDSVYKDLLLKIVPDAPIIEPRERSDTARARASSLTSGPSMDRPWTDNGPHIFTDHVIKRKALRYSGFYNDIRRFLHWGVQRGHHIRPIQKRIERIRQT